MYLLPSVKMSSNLNDEVRLCTDGFFARIVKDFDKLSIIPHICDFTKISESWHVRRGNHCRLPMEIFETPHRLRRRNIPSYHTRIHVHTNKLNR